MDFCCLICMHVHLEYRFACYRVCDLLWTCLVILVSLVVDLVWFVDLWWYLCTICVICGLVWWYMSYLRHLCDICDIWAICVTCEVFDLHELKLKKIWILTGRQTTIINFNRIRVAPFFSKLGRHWKLWTTEYMKSTKEYKEIVESKRSFIYSWYKIFLTLKK